MKTDLHNWNTIDELYEAERATGNILMGENFAALRIFYKRTGRSISCVHGVHSINRVKRYICDHVRPCV